MIYQTFTEEEQTSYKIVLLFPSLSYDEIKKHYIDVLGLDPKECIALQLMKTGKKTPVSVMKEWVSSELYPALEKINAKYIICGDTDYYKLLTKENKSETNLGYVLPDYTNKYNVVYTPSYKQIFYDPKRIKDKINSSLFAIISHITGIYTPPGTDIIKFSAYPKTYDEIKHWLSKLLLMKVPLTADIEAFSLRHTTAGIGTISFAWNQGEGIAFPVDLGPAGKAVRELLRDFFIAFTEKLIWHNISYDVYVLIYQLFMNDIEDTKGFLFGSSILLRNWEDTKLITYLATNSCAGNELSLKAQAQEFAGNYAQSDIADITKIPLDNLLRYNLIDALSTWYVYDKHYPTMVNDDQLDIYLNIFKPAIIDIIQMQLTGLPIDMDEVKKAKESMNQDKNDSLNRMQSLLLVQSFEHSLKEQWVIDKNNKLKVKRVSFSDVPKDICFNPNSDIQLASLLYEQLALPILDKTGTGKGSTGADSLKKLKNHTTDINVLILLDALIDYKAVIKILDTFIPAFEEATKGPSGQYYLFGFFNLGGTVSGRLSSNSPNLQNLPATGSKYAKIIKNCFRVGKEYLFIGLDFASLEDRISALTTKDPNKLKVYLDGYDGHCLRAYAYFGDEMPDIDPDNVESINSIADKYASLRQKSKSPTFALTYQGTYITLMNNCGFTEELAKKIEKSYHILYVVSDQWVKAKLDQASKVGYITVAFGLRVRTPLLHQVVRGTRATPHEAEAEGRTAGNALGQSWGLLNTRAASAFMDRVRKSKYALDIRPCAQIHDAQYYIIRNNAETLLWVNKHLPEEAKWQNHQDIYHPQVGLGGELSVFYPSWANELKLPNELTHEELKVITFNHVTKLREKNVI